ncbi:MAG TPA: GNAT family N-acetyltransferase [Terriglobales bacterium]|nr:GNAT family N-acetyltransferase [Terriglobales bacterium]
MITTPRLLLRPWRDSDRAPFAEMCADPEVMEFFPGCLTQKESDNAVDQIEAHQREHGFCLFAAELLGKHHFIGFIGLQHVPFETSFTPAVEIGWRLARSYWNRGLATEGALAVLNYAFKSLGLLEIVSFTVPGNIRSRRVMEKIGMHRDVSGDFDHPRLPPDHPLRRHVLYRASRELWEP